MITLCIDTASINCAVTLIDRGTIIAHVLETIGKGHAEKLIDQIDQVSKIANIKLEHINRIAVNIGPGSFTGVRIGVATARAFSLALEIPSIGVSSLEALAYQVIQQDASRPVSIILNAGRDMYYRQDFNTKMQPLCEAVIQSSEDIIASLQGPLTLSGDAAAIIIAQLEIESNLQKNIFHIQHAMADTQYFGLISETKQPNGSPHPLYLRDADAKPQIGFALPRKS